MKIVFNEFQLFTRLDSLFKSPMRNTRWLSRIIEWAQIQHHIRTHLWPAGKEGPLTCPHPTSAWASRQERPACLWSTSALPLNNICCDWNLGPISTMRSDHLSLRFIAIWRTDDSRHNSNYTNWRKNWVDKKLRTHWTTQYHQKPVALQKQDTTTQMKQKNMA